MSHKSVRQLIRDTALSLADNIQFVYAQKTDFNQKRDKKYPFIQLDPLTSTKSFTATNTTILTNYPIIIGIYELDKLEGSEDETTEILDDTDVIAQSFIRKMNLLSFTEDDTVTVATVNCTISNISLNPFIKQTADCLSGWILTFTLQVPDDFDYCALYAD